MKSRKRCPDCNGRLRLRRTHANGKLRVYECVECDYALRERIEIEVIEVEQKRGKWKRFERVEE